MRSKPLLPNSSLKKAIQESAKPLTHKLTVYIPIEIFDKVKMKALTEKKTLSDIYTEFSIKYIDA